MILTASKGQTVGKLATYTVGGMIVGVGSGIGIAAMPTPKKIGTGVAVGLPVGAGVGLVTGLITPGLPYKASTKDVLYFELDNDLSFGESK